MKPVGWRKDGKKVWQSNIGDVSVDKDKKGRIVEGHPIKRILYIEYLFR